MNDEPLHAPHHGGGHETQDFSFRYAVWLVPASLVGLALFLAVSISWCGAALSREMNTKQEQGVEPGLGPVRELRAEEDAYLQGAGETGSGRLSIERAMERMAGDSAEPRPEGSR